MRVEVFNVNDAMRLRKVVILIEGAPKIIIKMLTATNIAISFVCFLVTDTSCI